MNLNPSSALFRIAKPWRLSGFTFVLAGLFSLSATDAEARFSDRELRMAGFGGSYRGVARGRFSTWDERRRRYQSAAVSQPERVRVPVRYRTRVVGPTGSGTFSLVLDRITGNLSREIRIRQVYTGESYNRFYNEWMVASGTRDTRIRRRGGFGRPRFEMRFRDNFRERGQFNGGLYTSWNVSGRLQKR